MIAELDVLEVDQTAEHLQLGAAIDFVINLLDRRHGQRLGFHPHVDRVAGEGLDQFLDRARDGGGEEDRLPFVRHFAQDGLDVVDKAHVEHAIGFIQDHHLDLVEPAESALEVIHHPARRSDNDLRARAQAAKLPLVGLPAVDWQLAHSAFEEGELRNLFRHLHRQLARRAEHEHLRRAQAGVDLLDRGNCKRRRLAGTGLRLPDHISAFEQDRDRGRLDRRSLLEAHPLDCL